MELSILVTTVVSFLAPFLPHLIKAGEKAAEEAGKKMGEAAWDKAKALWTKLWPKVQSKPAAQEAVEDVGRNPQDNDALSALRLQVKKMLAEDAVLAQEIGEMVKEGVRDGVIAIAVGERSVALSEAKETIISTGDGATIIKVNPPKD